MGAYAPQKRPGLGALKRCPASKDEFEVYELDAATFVLRDLTNAEDNLLYLVVGSERAALIDTGLGTASVMPIVKQLTSLDCIALITHSHADHIGQAYLFDEVYCFSCPACIKQLQQGIPAGNLPSYFDSDFLTENSASAFEADSFSIPACEQARGVEDGHCFDLGGRSLQALFMPGHSADSLIFVDTARRYIFTGDLFYPGPLYAMFEDSDLQRYERSLRELRAMTDELDADYLLCGHNDIVTDFLQVDTAVELLHQIRGCKVHPSFVDEQQNKHYCLGSIEIVTA